ncbi:hypothetical protein CPB84DRAFT_912189 [Gymnopilus junonius]|uniref:Uncharacterized protein n=1 Tax=Gymnopilus junonius TaxID=109634 RepID=A0A9P5NQR4_GYMJU|nr:hypothetical protein CPB84DRAFT_912189 [Gymnopilus junonius]
MYYTSLLEIRDVINLSRLNRPFRDTLLSPSAASVWRSLRKPLDMPDPLGDISEVGWAELLFGNTCQDCGARNVTKPDLCIRRRLCRSCKNKSLIEEPDLVDIFEIQDVKSIRECVPSTRLNKADEYRYYYKPEVKAVVQKLNAFQKDMTTEDPEVIQNYHAFREERQKIVLSVLSGRKKCAKWQNQYIMLQQASKDQLIAQRRDAIFERLRQLGYADADIERQSDSPEVKQPKQLNERIWQNIRPVLEKKYKGRCQRAEEGRSSRSLRYAKRSH